MSETKHNDAHNHAHTQADPIVIVSAARTPMAAFQGDFATLTARNWAPLQSKPPCNGQASSRSTSTKS